MVLSVKSACPLCSMENLPNPGELLIYDYRDTTAQVTTQSIKVLQWNVERNYSKINLLLALTRSAFSNSEFYNRVRRDNRDAETPRS